MNFRKGTAKEKVYNILLQHEYMKTSTIVEKIGLKPSALSGALTELRRAGLAEYSGALGEDLRWKKHSINKPLYPPQADLRNVKNKNTNIKPDVTIETHIQHVDELLIELTNEFKVLRKQCKESIFIEHGEIGGVKIYRKSK